MRVLFDATVLQYPPTGIAKTLLFLYRTCSELYPAMEILAIHQRNLSCSLPVKLRSVQRGELLPECLWRSLIIPRSVKKYRPDLIHFPWNGNVPIFNHDIQVISTIHDVLPLSIPDYFSSERIRSQYRKRIQISIDRSDKIITDSEFSKKQIVNNFSIKSEPIVIYPGPTLPCDNAFFDAIDAEKKFYLYVGGYDIRKGIESLLTVCISLLKTEKVRINLVLTGSPCYYSEKLKDLIKEGKKLGIVKEMGYVTDAVLVNLYLNAKALIYPSKFEGFGLPPLEAMSLGCPVITTTGSSLPEVCGDAVMYIDPDDPKDFADALIRIERDDELRIQLGVRGRERASMFSWYKSASRFMKEIKK